MVRIQPKYTEVLINLLENENVKPLIDRALSTYPLYEAKNENEFIPNIIPTREELNKKILNYYKYREIGFETVGRFLDELEIAMNEIMPYYNQIFFTQDQDFNIIYNVDYQRTINRNRQEETTTESNTTSTATDTSETEASIESYNKNIESDTPQSQLSISNVNIDQVSYGSKASWNKDNSTNSATSEGSSETNGTATSEGSTEDSEETLETTKGNFGVVSAQDLIKKYREIIVNTEQEIINDPRISELFMMIY